MRQSQDLHITVLAMRLQLVFLTVVILFERSAAYAIQSETVSNSHAEESETDAVTDKPTEVEPKLKSPINNIRLMPLAFRPKSNTHLSIMEPEPNAPGPITLKRLSLVPLRGFFNFRSEQLGSDQVRQNELGNVSTLNCTNCPARYLPRQIAKRVAMASKVPRTRMPYDVPQIECPQARDGSERFSCPSPDRTNRYKCIEDRALCDGFIDCPNAEDEDMRACMFYKTTKAHLDVLADALLRWARGRY